MMKRLPRTRMHLRASQRWGLCLLTPISSYSESPTSGIGRCLRRIVRIAVVGIHQYWDVLAYRFSPTLLLDPVAQQYLTPVSPVGIARTVVRSHLSDVYTVSYYVSAGCWSCANVPSTLYLTPSHGSPSTPSPA
ncbi:hypothetical protein BV25DRAFT_590083 [Artomyces pyxidatus]|uniref:Uncharacterized protein n=1 Tax=Artomyces pyxidatus TaxID=48021 RepID=A0ACB8T1Q0_9AGAM|nr:hypothetical protein BV25DRAFT_590083 [Artomyces pyxidatus]